MTDFQHKAMVCQFGLRGKHANEGNGVGSMLPPVPGGLGGLSGNQGGRYCCAEPTCARWCPDGARSGPKCGGFVVLSKFSVILHKTFTDPTRLRPAYRRNGHPSLWRKGLTVWLNPVHPIALAQPAYCFVN
jgi:hypothetical protein